jgi:hypothetical protein
VLVDGEERTLHCAEVVQRGRRSGEARDVVVRRRMVKVLKCILGGLA